MTLGCCVEKPQSRVISFYVEGCFSWISVLHDASRIAEERLPPAIGLFESAALSTTAANALPTHLQIDTHDHHMTTYCSTN